MAVTQAQWQVAVAFARSNRLDPEDMCAMLELALMSPFLDANSGLQMVNLTGSQDGVSVTVGYDAALKLLTYFSEKANGGIVVQKSEFTVPNTYPGIFQ